MITFTNDHLTTTVHDRRTSLEQSATRRQLLRRLRNSPPLRKGATCP